MQRRNPQANKLARLPKNKIAAVSNILNASKAFTSLKERDAGSEGIGLIYGESGYGKSTAVTYLTVNDNALHIRARATWSANSMLRAITAELGQQPYHRTADNHDFIINQVGLTGRVLFIDEADYLVQEKKMLESLRDIYDNTEVPIFLIGMEGIQTKVKRYKQFSRRISQWVEFLPIDLKDAKLLVNTVCSIEVHDDLLAQLLLATNGRISDVCTGLQRIQKMATKQNWQEISLAEWGEQDFFFGQGG